MRYGGEGAFNAAARIEGNALNFDLVERGDDMEDKKKSHYSEAQKRATQKYMKENLDDIKFRVKKGDKEKYKAAAADAGLSMAQFFVTAAEEKIERDGLNTGAAAAETMQRDNEKA